MPPTKLLSLFLSFCLILEQSVFAQSIDLSHYFARNSSQAIPQSDKFRPLHLRYLGYDNLGQDFKILLDKGDTKKEDLENKTYIEDNTQTLLKYFFIGLALPNEKFWVNLRPDSPDNILDPELEKTDIGRIFLEADLQLKKDTAGLTSPQTQEGKVYWDKLYKRAGELFGTENITIPTITRPWIVPNEIIIREAPDNAYIYKATLKVMLEEDYLKGYQPSAISFQQSNPKLQPLTSNYRLSDPRLKELNEYSTQLIKETIIPKLTYEVNTSKRYAPLRQVYYSLILAQWFKQKYKGRFLEGSNSIERTIPAIAKLIDSGNLTSNFQPLTSQSPYSKETYFQQYQKSFKDGEYNLQEPVYTPMGQSIRRYVSGGMMIDCSSAITEGKVSASLALPLIKYGDGYILPAVTIKGGDVTLNSSSSIFGSNKTKKEETRKLLDTFGEKYDLNSAMIFKNGLLIKIKSEDHKIAFMNIAISIAEKLKKFKKEKNEYIDHAGWFFNSMYIYIYDHFINKGDMKIEDVLDSLNRFDMRLEEPGYMEAVLYFMSGRHEEALKNILLSNRELPDTAVVEVNDITRVITRDKIRELLKMPSKNILVLDSTADDYSFPYIFESILKDIQDLSSITKVKIPEARYQNFKSKINIAVIIEPHQEGSNIFEIELTSRDGQKKAIKYSINQKRNTYISTNKIVLLGVDQIEDLEKLPLGSIAGSITYFASRLMHALPLLGFLPIQLNNGNGYMKVVQHTQEEMKYLLESFNVFENIFNRPNFNFPELYDTVKKEISALQNIAKKTGAGSLQGRENIESLSSTSSAVVEDSQNKLNPQKMLNKLNSLGVLNLEYGLAKGRHISSQVWQFYTLLREILTENGFEAAVADRLAQTLAKMKNGSLEILVITGVIKEGERNIFVSKDSNKLRVLDNQEKEEFAGRLKRLYVSYRRNLNKTYQQTMLKRLIPLEIIELLSFEYDTSMGNIRHIISAHPDFQIRLPKVKTKVEQIKDRVGGHSNAWRIVISQGLDKTDTWLSLAESKVNSIQNKVGGSANAWAIVIGHGLDKMDAWLSLAESKVNSIQNKVGGSANAWRIVIGQGLDKIDTWLSLAESKVNSIQDRVGGSTNAWYIVIWQGLYKGGASLKSIDTDVINNDGNNIAGSTSSPSIPATGNKSGGIDFHALPIQTESVASSALSIFYGANAFKGNLDAEWARIQQVFNAGIRPSIQRLSEYTAAAAASPLAEDKIDQVRVMLADILRRDEESEKLASAEESCKQLLRALEAG